jgi:hypothetical protein
MFMNVSLGKTDFWENTFARGLKEAGYTTGAFGKTLNGGAGAESCGGPCTVPPHWDHWHVLCEEGYYNVSWNRGAPSKNMTSICSREALGSYQVPACRRGVQHDR